MSATSTQRIDRLTALHPRLIDLKLDRIERLLAALDHPQNRLPPVIHVAGTNGKGSTIAFMRAILEAAGLAVHVYTSPHLVTMHERIRLGRSGGGSLVTEADLAHALARCEEANQGLPITIFEVLTAAAVLLFSEHPADLLLLEVGLGGRYDATNIIEKPLATVITPVSFDHTDFLGSTIDAIALEKAGIIKPSTPVIVARQPFALAAQIIQKAALRQRAPLWREGEDYHVLEENGRLIYQDDRGMLDLPLPRLAGLHQQINAGTAIAALRSTGFGRQDLHCFEEGMRTASWPARLQNISKSPLAALLPSGSDLWLDGGHNSDGARAVVASLAPLLQRPARPFVLVTGLLNTKDSQAFLEQFRPLAPHVIAIPVPDQAASRPAAELAAQARQIGLTAQEAADCHAALSLIAAQRFETPPCVLICGSLYLAGDVLARSNLRPD